MFDIIIRNGTLIDGTGQPRFTADVAITDSCIVSIGNLTDATANRVIDAAGKIVCPGFVDVHNHSDGWLLKQQNFASKTLQGFTTEVLGLDGIGYAPVNATTAREWMFYMRTLDGLNMNEYSGWESLEEFMECIERKNVQNAATHIPYANVRSMVCGFNNHRVDDFQMRQIQYEIRKAMDEGAVGISTGLDYIVQCFSTTDELVEACSVMAKDRGLYATHMRYKKGLMPAFREAVEIARRADVPLHVSHLKAISDNSADEIMTYIDQEVRKDVDFTFDVYPYQPGSTTLSYLLPYEVWEDGPLAAMSKMNQPEMIEKFRQGLKAYRLNLDKLRIAWVAGKENTHLQGKLVSEFIAETGLPTEVALINLLIEERLSVLLVFDEGDDELVYPFLQHDLFMLGTDGIYAEGGDVHPRQFGSVGRMLGRLVRDEKLFTLEQAIHHMSGFPASRFGLTKRGELQEGYFADIVIFDAATITDNATMQNPTEYTTGIEEVIVNGVSVVSEGVAVKNLKQPLPGQFVRYHDKL